MTESSLEERVLVIPRLELFKGEHQKEFQGFATYAPSSNFLQVFDSEHLTYRPRSIVEKEPQYKQIIPYIYLTNEKGEIFGYQRTKAGGESRLHSKWSVGIGGHMNDGDKNFSEAISRELDEEVDLSDCQELSSLKTRGFINDDSNEVGTVHFGVVYNLKISGNPKSTKDKALSGMCWKTPQEWLKLELETWSKLVLENL